MSDSLRVAVIGGGIMGRGIASALAVSGHEVTVVEPDAAATAALAPGILVAADIESGVSRSDLVIEAVPEQMSIKTPVWQRMGAAAPATAILASNTSALDIDALAAVVPHPERVLGTHWFNPATVVPCVEIVRGTATSQGVIERVTRIMRDAGKAPVVVANSPGFVANRIQFALVREALLCLEEGLASAEDIDTIVSSSFGIRLAVLGPLANADLGGLDTYRSILEFLTSTLGERYQPPEILERLVAEGRLGTKTGAGISEYTSESAAAVAAWRDAALVRVIDAVGRNSIDAVGDRPHGN